ncbi:MAG: FG-GAP-like repeat-containing protein [Polyangiales bacterium]
MKHHSSLRAALLLFATGCASPTSAELPDVESPVDAVTPTDAPALPPPDVASGVDVARAEAGTDVPPAVDSVAPADAATPQDVVDAGGAVDVPTVDVPTVDVPTVDVPTVDVPTVDVPTVDVPTVDVPTVDASSLDASFVDVPVLDGSAVDGPPSDSGARDAGTGDAGGDAGGTTPGFAAEVAWRVPPNGLSDGFFTAGQAEGVRWWSLLDLNGDGRPDLVQTGDPARSGGYVFGAGTSTPTWRVFLNTGTGFATTATSWPVPNIGLSDGPYTTNIATGTRWWSTLDLDGDGRPELVQTGDPVRSGGYVFNAGTPGMGWRVFRNDGARFGAGGLVGVPSNGLSDGFYTASIATGTRWWITLDLNGDRRADLVQTGDPARTGGYVFGAGGTNLSWRVFLGR